MRHARYEAQAASRSSRRGDRFWLDRDVTLAAGSLRWHLTGEARYCRGRRQLNIQHRRIAWGRGSSCLWANINAQRALRSSGQKQTLNESSLELWATELPAFRKQVLQGLKGHFMLV